jgi:hypothetical protein
MRRFWTRKWFRVVAVLVAICCLIALLACWRFRIWSCADYRAYHEVRRYPIGEDLWFGRIKAGQGVEAFIADHPPHRTRRLGRFTQMSYYAVWPTPPDSLQLESLSVVAEDGQLVNAVAAGCTWERAFFEMNAASAAEFDRAWERDHGR